MTTQLEKLLQQRAKQVFSVEVHNLQTRAAGDTTLPDGAIASFTGYAVPWEQITDRVWDGKEQVQKDAIENDLVGLPILRDHDNRRAVGTIIASASDNVGQKITAIIADTELGRETAALLRIGSLSRMSISFIPREWIYDQENDIYTITRAEVVEVSIVPVPAYPGAAIDSSSQEFRGAQLNILKRSGSPVSVDEIATVVADEPSAAVSVEEAPAAIEGADSTEQTHEDLNATADTSTPPVLTEDRTDPEDREKEPTMSDIAATKADIAELRSFIEQRGSVNPDELITELQEKFREERASGVSTGTPKRETRSIGELLSRAIHEGDSEAEAIINKAQKRERADGYEGGVQADADIQPTYVADLVKIRADRSPLKAFYANGDLPKTGDQVATRVLKANTVKVEEHKEGQIVPRGNVELETKHFPIKTVAGGSTLSIEEIQRGVGTNIINRTVEAQTKALGRSDNDVIRAEYLAARTAAPSINKVDLYEDFTYEELSDLIVDEYGIFENQDADLKGIHADPDFFKRLQRMTIDGKPAFATFGDNVNVIGELTAKNGVGVIMTIPVVLDWGLSKGQSSFVDTDAIRYYDDKDAPFRLQQTQALTMTQDIVLYSFYSVGTEIPGGISPINLKAASTRPAGSGN